MAKGRIWLDYDTARMVLYVIEALRGGPEDRGNLLNALMLHVARGLPEEELPGHLLWDTSEDNPDGQAR